MSKLLTRTAVVCSWLAAGTLLGTLSLLLGFLAWRGLPVCTPGLFFGDTPALAAISGRLPVWDGIWPALAGTLTLVLLAGLFALPVGLGCGIYLAQYASPRLRRGLTAAVEVLAGIPSIVMGLFGFALILFLRHTVAPRANTSLLLAALCIALLILPYLVLATRNALDGLPESVRLLGPTLGFTPWQSICHILLPAASRGLLGGVVLALGRAAEDTAVIMLTGVVASAGMPSSLTRTFEALPFTIFYYSAQYQSQQELDRAFGAALVLLAVTGLLFGLAFWLHKSMEKRWK